MTFVGNLTADDIIKIIEDRPKLVEFTKQTWAKMVADGDGLSNKNLKIFEENLPHEKLSNYIKKTGNYLFLTSMVEIIRW